MPDLGWTEKVGIAGVCIILIYCFYKIIMFLLNQWQASTDALNRNSEAFERAHAREIEFQEKALAFQKEAIVLIRDTNKKVADIHSRQQSKGVSTFEN